MHSDFYLKLCEKEKKKKNKVLARKRRRRGRARQRAARQQASNDRDQARSRELIIATHNVRTMAVDDKHGVGRPAEVLGVYQGMGCDIENTRKASSHYTRDGEGRMIRDSTIVLDKWERFFGILLNAKSD